MTISGSGSLNEARETGNVTSFADEVRRRWPAEIAAAEERATADVLAGVESLRLSIATAPEFDRRPNESGRGTHVEAVRGPLLGTLRRIEGCMGLTPAEFDFAPSIPEPYEVAGLAEQPVEVDLGPQPPSPPRRPSHRHRQNDPVTSVSAASAIEPVLGGHEWLVLVSLVQAGRDGLIDHDHPARNGLSTEAARKRRKELVDRGLVEATGRTRLSPAGRQAIVWRATEAGIAAHACNPETDRLLSADPSHLNPSPIGRQPDDQISPTIT